MPKKRPATTSLATKSFSAETLAKFEDASAGIPLRPLLRVFENAGLVPAADPGGVPGARKVEFRRHVAGVDQTDAMQVAKLGDALGAMVGEVATSKVDYLVRAAASDGFAFADGTFRPATTGESGGQTAASAVEPQTLIAVRDVRASSRWYSTLLRADSLPEHPHRDVYERISVAGRAILQLHVWDEEDHPNLTGPGDAPHGHGVVLWFRVNDFDAAVLRARELGAEIVEEPHVNPAPMHREMWLRDADGYVVVICSPDGEAASP